MLELRSIELKGGLRVKEQELRLLPASLRLLKNLKRSDTGNDEGSISNTILAKKEKNFILNHFFPKTRNWTYVFLFQFLYFSQNRLLFACFLIFLKLYI